MLPLAGIKIVEFSQVIAAPFSGAIFADLGAEVIKIEKPNGGDDGRSTGAAYLHGDSLTFLELNRGKRSVTLDLKAPGGVDAMQALIGDADVFLHNQRPDVARAFGFDGATLTALFPRLIYCQISAFGHVGPLELAPGYESIVQSYSGLASTNGFPEMPPVRVGASVCDLGTGMWAVIGILSALRNRDLTGQGTIVNTSLLETALSWTASAVNSYINTGKEPVRQGTAFTNMVPYQTFEAADASIVICAGNDRLFSKLAEVLGHPEWPRDERFATNRARLQNRPAIIAEIAEVLSHDTAANWYAKLTAAGVPCTLVNSVPEVVQEPQVAELGIIQQVEDAPLKLVGLPLSFGGERVRVSELAPRLGQHGSMPADQKQA